MLVACSPLDHGIDQQPAVIARPIPAETGWQSVEGLQSLVADGRSRRARLIQAGEGTDFAIDCSSAQVLALSFEISLRDAAGRAELVATIGAESTRFRLESGVGEGWQEIQINLDKPIETGSLSLDFEAEEGELALTAPSFRCRGKARPNILLISADTLRADRLGYSGYQRSTSPFIDRLAASGIVFSEAYSTAPWTTPSHMSMLTSLMPSSHAVNGDVLLGDGNYSPLSPSVPLLAEILRGYGYRRLALTGGGTVSDHFGFGRGFEHYDESIGDLDDSDIETVLGSISELDRPWFFFLHTFETHAPYTDGRFAGLGEEETALIERLQAENLYVAKWPELLKEAGIFDLQTVSDLYDGDIARLDEWLEALFDQAGRRGLFDNTIVVLTSDHGEEFGDHNDYQMWDAHCTSTHREQLHVPLIFRLPPGLDLSPSTIETRVSTLDLMPTLLDLVGIERPSHLQGESLLPAFQGHRIEREVISEAMCRGPESKSLRRGDRTLVIRHHLPKETRARAGIQAKVFETSLFDFIADPAELESLLEQEPEQAGAMVDRLYEYFGELPAYPPGQEIERDEELDENLRALGYLN